MLQYPGWVWVWDCGLRFLDFHFGLGFNFFPLVLFHLLMPKITDGNFVSNIKVISAATGIQFLNQIGKEIVTLMEFKIFIGGSLNKETIAFQETADGNLDLHLLQFGAFGNSFQCSVQQSPHTLLVPCCAVVLVKVCIEFVNIIRIKEVICINFTVQVTNIGRRNCFKQNSVLVVRFKSCLDVIVAVFEIQYKGSLIIRRANSVQSRESGQPELLAGACPHTLPPVSAGRSRFDIYQQR